MSPNVKQFLLPAAFFAMYCCSFCATLNSKNIPGHIITKDTTPVIALTQLIINKIWYEKLRKY